MKMQQMKTIKKLKNH